MILASYFVCTGLILCGLQGHVYSHRILIGGPADYFDVLPQRPRTSWNSDIIGSVGRLDSLISPVDSLFGLGQNRQTLPIFGDLSRTVNSDPRILPRPTDFQISGLRPIGSINVGSDLNLGRGMTPLNRQENIQPMNGQGIDIPFTSSSRLGGTGLFGGNRVNNIDVRIRSPLENNFNRNTGHPISSLSLQQLSEGRNFGGIGAERSAFDNFRRRPEPNRNSMSLPQAISTSIIRPSLSSSSLASDIVRPSSGISAVGNSIPTNFAVFDISNRGISGVDIEINSPNIQSDRADIIGRAGSVNNWPAESTTTSGSIVSDFIEGTVGSGRVLGMSAAVSGNTAQGGIPSVNGASNTISRPVENIPLENSASVVTGFDAGTQGQSFTTNQGVVDGSIVAETNTIGDTNQALQLSETNLNPNADNTGVANNANPAAVADNPRQSTTIPNTPTVVVPSPVKSPPISQNIQVGSVSSNNIMSQSSSMDPSYNENAATQTSTQTGSPPQHSRTTTPAALTTTIMSQSSSTDPSYNENAATQTSTQTRSPPQHSRTTTPAALTTTTSTQAPTTSQPRQTTTTTVSTTVMTEEPPEPTMHPFFEQLRLFEQFMDMIS